MANLVTDSAGDGKNILSYDEKKTMMTDRLVKREEDRLDGLQKKKDDKEKLSAADENAKVFTENFSTARRSAEEAISKCDVIDKSGLASHFDSVSKSLQGLQKLLTDSTLFLPSYEVRAAQDVISKLNSCLQEKRDVLLPKKKFAFRSKKKVAEKVAPTPPVQEEANGNKTASFAALTDCGFKNLESQTLVMSGSEIEAKDIALSNLEDCIVKLEGAPCAIHIDKLKNCTVFSGPVAGSIFVDDCIDCTFVVACQQLRVHTTTKTKFYIHVTSRAIIEDCNDTEFAPYSWKYGTVDKDFETSGLDHSRNNWNDVDDFNWLASDKHSPNWKIMAEDDRVTNWN